MRVGKRILELMETAEVRGRITSRILMEVWPEVQPGNRGKYLRRAEAMGFLKQDIRYTRVTFKPVAGWREKVFGDEPRKYEKTGKFAKPKDGKPRTIVNSVFALGQGIQQ